MENKKNREIVVEELIALISKGNAHVSFEEAVSGVDLELLTVVPDKLPYSIWQLIEHIRIAQWDIIEFCLSGDHESPEWPAAFWPDAVAAVKKEDFEKSLQQISEDRIRFFELLKDPSKDLYQPFTYGDGQNLFREALLIADHTAYHVGEVIIIRRLLGNWKS